jgi:hypothetical protein
MIDSPEVKWQCHMQQWLVAVYMRHCKDLVAAAEFLPPGLRSSTKCLLRHYRSICVLPCDPCCRWPTAAAVRLFTWLCSACGGGAAQLCCAGSSHRQR